MDRQEHTNHGGDTVAQTEQERAESGLAMVQAGVDTSAIHAVLGPLIDKPILVSRSERATQARIQGTLFQYVVVGDWIVLGLRDAADWTDPEDAPDFPGLALVELERGEVEYRQGVVKIGPTTRIEVMA